MYRLFQKSKVKLLTSFISIKGNYSQRMVIPFGLPPGFYAITCCPNVCSFALFFFFCVQIIDLLYLFFLYYFILICFGDTLSSKDILYGITSGNLLLIFDRTISKTVNRSINRTPIMNMCWVLIGRLITADWLVENMNPDVT